MKKIFARKEIFKVKSHPIDPGSLGEPASADDFLKRGMAYYARKQLNSAEADLKASIDKDRTQIDAYYCLGMVYKAWSKKQQAIEAFTQVLNLISADPKGNTTKYGMMRRLALGHINVINQGDWNLEKEIWKHTP